MSEAEAALLLEELRALKRENELLRQKLDALARRLFGPKSEQLDKNQLLLLLQEAETPGPALGKGSGPEAQLAEPPRPTKASSQKPRKKSSSPSRSKPLRKNGGALERKSASAWIMSRRGFCGCAPCGQSM